MHKVDGGWGGNLLGKSLRSRGLDLAVTHVMPAGSSPNKGRVPVLFGVGMKHFKKSSGRVTWFSIILFFDKQSWNFVGLG